MGLIEHEMKTILSFLEHEKKVYTEALMRSPEGGLIHEKWKGKQRYLQCIPCGKDAAGRRRYERRTITGERIHLLGELAGKEYAKSALRILDRNLSVLGKAMDGLQEYSQEAIFAGMRSAYRQLPEECFLPIRRAKEITLRQHQWAEEPYKQSDYRVEEKIHISSRGLAMRTRAEVLIAEALYRYDIPFRYEQVFPIGKHSFAPDFTFLDRKENEFYWDYCGMMGSPDYAQHQIWRRSMYENAGVTEWNDMIYTYDAADGIDMRVIEAVIKTKILPRVRADIHDVSPL